MRPEGTAGDVDYGLVGATYSRLRRPDPPVAAIIHAALGDASMQRVATLQAQLLRDKYRAIRILSGLSALQRTRRAVAAIGADIEAARCSMIAGIEPQRFGHDWSAGDAPPR